MVLCIGQNHDPWKPTEEEGFKNLDAFKGEAIHSSKIRSIKSYVEAHLNQTILIVGTGMSAQDLLD